MNEENNALTVQVETVEGLQDLQVGGFINSNRIMNDVIHKPPFGLKRKPSVVTVEKDDCYNSSGRIALKATVYAKMRDAAGIQILHSEEKNVMVDGEQGASVTVWASRKKVGGGVQESCKTASASYTMAVDKMRDGSGNISEKGIAEAKFFLARKLETAALNRLTKEMLGEPTSYLEEELSRCHGCFLIIGLVADESIPEVRTELLRQATEARASLFGNPKLESLPAAAEAEVLTDDEFRPGEGGKEGAAAPVAAIADTSDSKAQQHAAPDLPFADYAVDALGMPDFGIADLEKLRTDLLAEMEKVSYDSANDPGDVVSAAKTGDLVLASRNFYKFIKGGE